MARTRLALWTEGSIVTAILTFFLLAAFPIAASGTPESAEDPAPPARTAREEALLGTYAAHNTGLFFPPNASLYMVPYSTNRDQQGGPIDEISVPSIFDIHPGPSPMEVFRSPVDSIFELNPARTMVKPLRIEF